jgi:hypothetical protein
MSKSDPLWLYDISAEDVPACGKLMERTEGWYCHSSFEDQKAMWKNRALSESLRATDFRTPIICGTSGGGNDEVIYIRRCDRCMRVAGRLW